MVFPCASSQTSFPIDLIFNVSPLITRFRVNVQVEDPTGSTTVVLFNAAVERLLDVSARKIVNAMAPGDTSVPAELQPLLGREFVFKLKLNKYNLVDGLQDYGVSAVYTPLAELESAHAKKTLEAVCEIYPLRHTHIFKLWVSTFTYLLFSLFRLAIMWRGLRPMMPMLQKAIRSERGS